MEINNIEALIAQDKIALLAGVDPTQSYVQISVFQRNSRKRGGDGNSYAPYAMPISELLSAGGVYTGSNGITLVGNDFQFTSQNISQFTNDSGYITSAAIPITLNVIPKGSGTSIVDGSWEFSGNSLTPTISGSDIGSATRVVGNLYMGDITPTITYGGDLYWIAIGGPYANRMTLTQAGNLGVGTPGPNARIHSVGSTSDNTTFGLAVDSFGGSNWFNVRNDGAVNIFGGGGNDATLSVRQRDFAFPIAFEVYGNTFNRLIRTTDTGSTGRVDLANEAISIDMYAGTIRMGGVSPGGTVRLDVIPIAAGDTIYVRAFGFPGGTIIGDDGAGNAWIYLQNASATTTARIASSGTSFINGDLGVGLTSGITAKLHVRGVDATVANYCIKLEDNIGTNLMSITNSGVINISATQTGNAGLVSGDLYVDTAANILANGDLVVGRRV